MSLAWKMSSVIYCQVSTLSTLTWRLTKWQLSGMLIEGKSWKLWERQANERSFGKKHLTIIITPWSMIVISKIIVQAMIMSIITTYGHPRISNIMHLSTHIIMTSMVITVTTRLKTRAMERLLMTKPQGSLVMRIQMHIAQSCEAQDGRRNHI